MEKTILLASHNRLIVKIYDYGLLIKFKLLLFVVFSASFAFLLGSEGSINWNKFILLSLGGFLVTGSANGLNEIFEKDFDKLMKRTMSRPLPDGRMSVNEAIVVSILFGITGIFLLSNYLNITCGILGMLALFLYAFAYTPMKRTSPFSVFVGAIPGAMPPMIGWVAATGYLSFEAFILFTLQFFWQFPHFWAIAWRLDDEYKKAGFKMLPSNGGKDKATAFQVVVYTVSLIPVGLMPYIFHISGPTSAIILTIAGLFFTYYSLKLYKSCSDKAAKQVMFASIIYLPIVMAALVLDKI
ncbi:MAG: heme o synthase [Bacteroidia bacterium]